MYELRETTMPPNKQNRVLVIFEVLSLYFKLRIGQGVGSRLRLYCKRKVPGPFAIAQCKFQGTNDIPTF